MATYISLGWNCQSRITLVELRMERRKRDGFATCPFDLMGSYYPGLCLAFENYFEDFYNPDFLYITGDGIIRNSKYGVSFLHESPNHFFKLGRNERWTCKDHFLKNRFAEFQKRYKARFEKFYEYLQNGPIVFVINRYNSAPVELDEIISRKFPHLKYIIACINTFEEDIPGQKELECRIYTERFYSEDTSELERFSRPLVSFEEFLASRTVLSETSESGQQNASATKSKNRIFPFSLLVQNQKNPNFIRNLFEDLDR